MLARPCSVPCDRIAGGSARECEKLGVSAQSQSDRETQIHSASGGTVRMPVTNEYEKDGARQYDSVNEFHWIDRVHTSTGRQAALPGIPWELPTHTHTVTTDRQTFVQTDRQTEGRGAQRLVRSGMRQPVDSQINLSLYHLLFPWFRICNRWRPDATRGNRRP